MKVTVKGQVTIPRHIREKLGIKPRGEVEFVEEDGKIVVRAVDRSAGDDRFEAALRRSQGCFTSGLTTDEVMEMTRGEK